MELRSKKIYSGLASVLTETDQAVSKVTFEDLPTEIIIKIFSYLKQTELGKTTSRVCKTWREISFDPHLWKAVEIVLSGRGVHEEDCERYVTLLNRCVLLESLLFNYIHFNKMPVSSIQMRKKFPPSFFPIVPKRLVKCLGAFASLKKLYFSGCIVRAIDIMYLVSNCPLIEDLQFQDCKLICQNVDSYNENFVNEFNLYSPSEPWPAFSYIAKLENLKVFRVNPVQGSNFGNATLEIFARHCNKLQSISISDGSEITDDGFIELVKHCNQTLKNLELTGVDYKICDGFQYLQSCKYLVSLKLESVQLTSECIQALVELPQLENLVLSSTEDSSTDENSPDGFSNLFSHPYRSNIKEVYLKSFNFGEEALIGMGGNCPNLQKLSLINCQGITDNGLGKVIENCTELSLLDISLSKPLYGNCLHKVKRCLPRLKRLDVGTLLVKKYKLLSSLKKELTYFTYDTIGVNRTFFHRYNTDRIWILFAKHMAKHRHVYFKSLYKF